MATLRGGTGTGSGSSNGWGTGRGLVMSLERIFRVRTWLSVRGSIGEPGVGLGRASGISWMLAGIRSLDKAIVGMVTLVGNQQVSVLQVGSDQVSHIQTL